MKQSEAWIIQVKSDFAAAEKLYVDGQDVTYCQAIAKYQQTVEKSVKAMVAAVEDLGVPFFSITPSHLPGEEISALLRLRRAIDNTSIEVLADLFRRHRSGVENLCYLAPKWPERGQPFLRNTEYPFETEDGWNAPAVPGTFSRDEVRSARQTAWVFHRKAIDFVRLVKRGRS